MDLARDKSLRVLVFDDIELAQSYMRYTLDSIGLRNVTYENNANRAYRMINEQNIDLVLCSYSAMREADGYHLYEELQNNKALPHSTAFIFISSDSNRYTIRRLVELQPDGLILKPFTVKQFEQKIQRVLKRYSTCRDVLRYIDEGNRQKALVHCDHLLNTELSTPIADHIKRLKGSILIHLCRYQEALEFYQQQCAPDTNNWAMIGAIEAFDALGKDDQAEKMLFTLSLKAENQLVALDMFAQRQLNKKQFQQALDSTKMAAELSPLNRHRQHRIFELSRLVRDTESQQSAAQMLVKLTKDTIHYDEDHWLRVARSSIDYGQLSDEKELQTIERQVKQHLNAYKKAKGPNVATPQATVIESRLAHLKNKPKLAESLLASVPLQNYATSSDDDLLDLSKAHHALNNSEQASAVMQELLKRHKTKTDEPLIKTLVEQQTKLQQAIPDSPKILNQRGVTYFQQKRYVDAFQCFKQANALVPKHPSVSLNLLQSIVYLPSNKYAQKNNAPVLIKRCNNVLQNATLTSAQQETLNKLHDIIAQRV